MASILDGLSDLTLNIQEATQDSDLIKVNPFLLPQLTNVHAVITGVNADKYIPILGRLPDIGLADPGSCGVNAFTGKIPVSEKLWSPKLFSHRIALCADDIPARLKFWKNEQVASKRWESIAKPLEQWVLDLATQAMSDAILRIAEFSNKTAALASGGGYITSTATLALINQINGMWEQIFADGAGAGNIKRYTIEENNQATKAAQMALADNAAFEVFMYLVENFASNYSNETPVIQCTKGLYDNYVRYLTAKSGAYNPALIKDGFGKDTFMGYPIIVREDWTRKIEAYHDLGTTYYLPHRAIMSGLNNIPIGTSDTESFSAFDAFFDKKDKKLYIDLAWRQDCKVLLEEAIVAAY